MAVGLSLTGIIVFFIAPLHDFTFPLRIYIVKTLSDTYCDASNSTIVLWTSR